MVKCKRCGIDDLTWDTEAQERTGKWRLWNPSTERPHECSKKKETHEQTYSSPQSKHDKKLWKTAWKPEMDIPSQRVCGKCKTICVIANDCEYCENFNQNPCEDWCPKCEEHPRVIYVEKEPKAYAEFLKKNPPN